MQPELSGKCTTTGVLTLHVLFAGLVVQELVPGSRNHTVDLVWCGSVHGCTALYCLVLAVTVMQLFTQIHLACLFKTSTLHITRDIWAALVLFVCVVCSTAHTEICCVGGLFCCYERSITLHDIITMASTMMA